MNAVIEREHSRDGRHWRYILRPHRGATWGDNLLLFASIAALAVPVAMAWAIMGFWPVLPLCGLELGFVGVVQSPAAGARGGHPR